MMLIHLFKYHLGRFRREESGVALVEFAIFLPVFVLSFFVIVEFSRIFFSYQGAVVGVRDSARYLGRVAAADLCSGAEATDTGANPGDELQLDGDVEVARGIARTIIERNMDNESRVDLPEKVFLSTVSVSYECVISSPGDYRQVNVPIVSVFATFRIELPLGGILELNNLPLLPEITHEVADSSRVFGT